MRDRMMDETHTTEFIYNLARSSDKDERKTGSGKKKKIMKVENRYVKRKEIDR